MRVLVATLPLLLAACLGPAQESDEGGPTGVIHGVTFLWKERSDAIEVAQYSGDASWGRFGFQSTHSSLRANLNQPAKEGAGVEMPDGQEVPMAALSTSEVKVGDQLRFCRTVGDGQTLVGIAYTPTGKSREATGGTWFRTIRGC